VAALAVSLQAGALKSHPGVWFALAVAALLVALLQALRGRAVLPLLLSAALLVSALGKGQHTVKLLYMPYMAIAGLFLEPAVFLPAWVWVLALEGQHLGQPSLLSLWAVGAGVGLAGHAATRRLRRQRAELLLRLRQSQEAALSESRPPSEAQELQEVLALLSRALGADCVALFQARSPGQLSLTCSTQPLRPRPEGLLWWVLKRGQAVLVKDLQSHAQQPGYERQVPLRSFMAAPLREAGYTLAVVAVDRAKEGAFGPQELSLLEQTAGLLKHIILRHRVVRELERSHEGLKVLQGLGEGFLQSPGTQEVCHKALQGTQAIAPHMAAAVLLRQQKLYKVAALRGLRAPQEPRIGLRGSLLETVLKGTEGVYIPDLSAYSLPPLPFGAAAKAALMLPLPAEEGPPLGALCLVSETPEPLSPYQVELLQVLAQLLSAALQRALLQERLRLLASTDGLTGLLNHRHFQERFQEELKRLRRYPSGLCLLLMDIDHFKKVNDTYGHPVGDMVLRGVAGVLRGVLRETDVPARYGGEEFAALLLDSTKEEGLAVAERLRKAIEKSSFHLQGRRQPLKVTVSIGLASWPQDGPSREALIRAADAALYRAKREGRNQVQAAR
jgi:diguanylate cyclase (GGDEF)-like protein